MKLIYKAIGLMLAFSLALGGIVSATTYTCSGSSNSLSCIFPSSIETLINKIANSTAVKMTISGTEYNPNTNGTVSVRLVDANGVPVNLASCNTTVYYPNKTSLFLNNQPMTFLNQGNYYKDFTLGSETGVFITNVNCLFPASLFASNLTYNGQTISSGSIQDNLFFDNSANVTINSAYISMNSKGSASSTVAGLYLNGILLGNNTGSSTQTLNVTLNQANFAISETQPFSVTQLGSGTITLNWVFLRVNFTWNNPSQIIRGQNEIHVSNSCNLNITNTTVNITNTTTILNITNGTATNVNVVSFDPVLYNKMLNDIALTVIQYLEALRCQLLGVCPK